MFDYILQLLTHIATYLCKRIIFEISAKLSRWHMLLLQDAAKKKPFILQSTQFVKGKLAYNALFMEYPTLNNLELRICLTYKQYSQRVRRKHLSPKENPTSSKKSSTSNRSRIYPILIKRFIRLNIFVRTSCVIGWGRTEINERVYRRSKERLRSRWQSLH